MMRRWSNRGATALGVVWFAACGGNEYAPPPPPRVTVERPSVRDVTRFLDYTGTTRPVESATIRARVKGFLQGMHYEPGTFVEAGALLFTIDPEPFQVALDAAEAELISHEAELSLSQTEFERTETMYKQKATSEILFIKSRAKRDKAAAAVAASRAAVHSAELDLDYAHVKAPFDGRAGRHYVDIGNLVGSGEATSLTEVIRYSPLYVYFHVSERDLLGLQDLSAERRRQAGAEYADRPPQPLYIGRENEDGYPHEGVVEYSGLEVDPATGTFEFRGILENTGELDQIILPGTFVRVRIPIGNQKDALLVSERALGADQNGRFVLVVNDDDVVEHRPVELGAQYGEERLIQKGLRAEDRVIVNGLQRARPGSKVVPEKSGKGAPVAALRADSGGLRRQPLE